MYIMDDNIDTLHNSHNLIAIGRHNDMYFPCWHFAIYYGQACVGYRNGYSNMIVDIVASQDVRIFPYPEDGVLQKQSIEEEKRCTLQGIPNARTKGVESVL